MIIVRIWEGLGNQLFQYAFARAYSLKMKQAVKIDTNKIFEKIGVDTFIERKYALDNFNIVLKPAGDKELKHYNFLEQKNLLQAVQYFFAKHHLGRYSYWEESSEEFAPDVKSFGNGCYVKGWFQNQKYFKDYRTILLRELTPKKKIVIDKKLRQVLEGENTVSVHIRRGDYKKYGCTLPIEYYKKAYLKMSARGDFDYLIFSDDLKWAKENLDFISNKTFINEDGKLKDYEELMIMSRCHHNIIANSTFSWWGAWLNVHADKLVIAPKRWFLHKALEDDYDIIPEEWIRL